MGSAPPLRENKFSKEFINTTLRYQVQDDAVIQVAESRVIL